MYTEKLKHGNQTNKLPLLKNNLYIHKMHILDKMLQPNK